MRDLSQKEAIQAVKFAIGLGVLEKPVICSECREGDWPIQAHHRFGYEACMCLAVKWLCSPCHTKVHRKKLVYEPLKDFVVWWKENKVLRQATYEFLVRICVI